MTFAAKVRTKLRLAMKQDRTGQDRTKFEKKLIRLDHLFRWPDIAGGPWRGGGGRKHE